MPCHFVANTTQYRWGVGCLFPVDRCEGLSDDGAMLARNADRKDMTVHEERTTGRVEWLFCACILNNVFENKKEKIVLWGWHGY